MADTRALWRLRVAGRFRFVSSQMVIDEIADAPMQVRELFGSAFATKDVIAASDEIEEQAAAYMSQKVLPPKYANDAHHVIKYTGSG